MSKIDCSKTLNYAHEFKRMCDTYGQGNACISNNCPFEKFKGCAPDDITQEHISILQKWSDEHPQQTMAEKFFEIFPNAKKMSNGLPIYCPHYLGWGEYERCPKGQGIDISCDDCWNRPYSKVAK